MLKEKKAKYQNKFKIDINDYLKVKLIKKGGFGIVYLVKDKVTSKEYAAKVLISEEDAPIDHQMVNREIGIMIRVQHPTIIQFRGYSLEDLDHNKNVVIIMDYAKKGSLSKILQDVRNSIADKDYTNTERQIILVGIARGMMYLHKEHIIHRDLKPENILIDENFHPLITDFGLSKVYEVGHSMSQSKTCGTSIYMAPEVISGDRYNGKSDVYAFGILMFEVLTESLPYPLYQLKRMSDFTLKSKVVNEDYRPEFTVPIKPALKGLIMQCWARNPRDRPTFEEIYNKLAFNIENSEFDIYNEQTVDDKDDTEEDNNKYYLDDIDVDELLCYIDDINVIFPQNEADSKSGADEIAEIWKQLQQKDQVFQKKISYLKRKINEEFAKKNKEISSLKEGNEELKQRLSILEEKLNEVSKSGESIPLKKKIDIPKLDDNITIQKFNSLPLKFQQSVVSKRKTETYFQKLNEILIFFTNFDDFDEDSKYFIEIPSSNSKQQLNDIKKNDRNIILLSNAIETLYKHRSLDSPDLINLLKQFDDIVFQIKYPLNGFQAIYNIISSVKLSNLEKIKIDVLVTEINNNKMTFEKFQNINIAEINDTITSLNSCIFMNCTSLAQVIIPISVTSIGERSFSGCSSIKKIEIPPSISSIGESCFSSCNLLKEIIIPTSVSLIEKYAFSKCSSLKKVVIPSSVTSIEEGTFSSCSSLKEITIPSSITVIKEKAFSECSSLTKIDIPPTVINIQHESFSDCSNLKELTIDPYSTKIESDTFSKCPLLKHLIINSSSDTIMQLQKDSSRLIYNYEKYSSDSENLDIYLKQERSDSQDSNPEKHEESNSFYVPHTIEEITIKKSPKKIESKAFCNFNSITKIDLPDSILYIESEAFKGCTSLQEIVIPSSVTSIEERTFSGCSSLKGVAIPSSVKEIKERAFSRCTSLTKINIPNSITHIGDNAFYSCNSLAEIEIDLYSTKIDINSFIDCPLLRHLLIYPSIKAIKEFYVDDLNKPYYSKEEKNSKSKSPRSVIKTIRSKNLYGNNFYALQAINEITIPNTVKLIEDNAFYGTSFIKIMIPSSVLKIGNQAFKKCSSLKEIFIPSSVELIGNECFSSCSSLKVLTIDLHKTKIEHNSFLNCKKLKHFIVSQTVNSIDPFYFKDYIYSENDEIKSSKLKYDSDECKSGPYDSNEYKSDPYDSNEYKSEPYNFYSDEKSESENEQLSEKKEESYKYPLPFIQEVTIPNSVIKIKEKAFCSFSSLKIVTIPTSVNFIGNNCFLKCSSLEKVVIPSSVTSIEEGTFSGCSSLKEITIPSSIKMIKEKAFSDCSNLKELTIDPYSTKIERDAFKNCPINTLKISPTVEVIKHFDFDLFFTSETNYKSIKSPRNRLKTPQKNDLYIIIIPPSVKVIENNAFAGCAIVNDISIPLSVTSIGANAFKGCSSLYKITIPSSVASIGANVFKGCSSLHEITINSSISTSNLGINDKKVQINYSNVEKEEKEEYIQSESDSI